MVARRRRPPPPPAPAPLAAPPRASVRGKKDRHRCTIPGRTPGSPPTSSTRGARGRARPRRWGHIRDRRSQTGRAARQLAPTPSTRFGGPSRPGRSGDLRAQRAASPITHQDPFRPKSPSPPHPSRSWTGHGYLFAAFHLDGETHRKQAKRTNGPTTEGSKPSTGETPSFRVRAASRFFRPPDCRVPSSSDFCRLVLLPGLPASLRALPASRLREIRHSRRHRVLLWEAGNQ